MARFIQVHNHVVNLENIAYVDFLESGRAMIFVTGLSMEKQNIAVEPEEARRLRAFIDAEREDNNTAPTRVNGFDLAPLRR